MIFKKLILFSEILLCQSVFALQPLSDEQLSNYTGQSLYSLSYISSDKSDNPNINTGFYKLNLNADVEVNANIKKLQLGCGGLNGVKSCDIDISNIRLTGVNKVGGSYVNSDAIFNNPFIEFAIKNPNSASNRELIGIRLGAGSILGKLSIGENSNKRNYKDDTGIKTLSGDIGVNINGGRIQNGCITGLFGICHTSFTANLNPKVLNISGSRMERIDINGLHAKTGRVGLLPLGIQFNNINIKGQPLNTIHEFLLSDDSNGNKPTSDFTLSFQKEDIYWMRNSKSNFNKNSSKRGWWLSIPNVQINDLNITQKVNISNGQIIGGLVGLPINLNPVDLKQVPVKNCYGNLKFC